MVDRIDKTDTLEYWRVGASTESRKGQNQGEENPSEKEKDSFADLHEKTDWRLFLDKTKLWKNNIQVAREEIDHILFKSLNLKTDPSLLRIDILLKGGSKISPAFVSISRITALKLKNLNPDQKIPPDFLFQNNLLKITIPAKPELFAEEEKTRQTTKMPKKEPGVLLKDEETIIHKTVTLKFPGARKYRTTVVYGTVILLMILILWGLVKIL